MAAYCQDRSLEWLVWGSADRLKPQPQAANHVVLNRLCEHEICLVEIALRYPVLAHLLRGGPRD